MEGELIIFVFLAVLIARGYARSRPPGYDIKLRDRVVVGLMVFAVAGILFGTVVFRQEFAPDVTFWDRVVRGLTVAGLGVAPLAIFGLITWALRITHYCESAYRRRY